MIDAVGTFVKFEDKYLFIKRAAHIRNPNVWALPGGQIEKGETPEQAAVRETLEETSLQLDEKKLRHLGNTIQNFPELGLDVTLHNFFIELQEKPQTKITEDKITEIEFLTTEEVLSRPYILGLDKCIELLG